MTLVIGIATPEFALHVSDRLVSKGGRTHDPLANKTVVFKTTDGLVAIGYTGPAYLDGMPTDEWIADVASGGACGDAREAMTMRGAFPVKNLGSTLALMSYGLRSQPIFERVGGELIACGWQWNARRKRTFARPVLWVLHRGSGVLAWEQLMPRHLPGRKTQFKMWRIGQWTLGPEAWSELVAGVQASGSDWRRTEALVVEAIRQASEHVHARTVGPHCMSVLVRPDNPNARIRFVAATPHLMKALGQDVQVAYTPWIVAQDAITAPSVNVGGLDASEWSRLSFSVDAPEPPDTQLLKGALQRQDRSGP